MMKRALSVEDSVALVKDVLYEVDEMPAAMEFDEAFMTEANACVTEPDRILNGLEPEDRPVHPFDALSLS